VLLNWVDEMRAKSFTVSRRMIRDKTSELSLTVLADGLRFMPQFKASRSWLDNFILRHWLSVRRRTTGAQKTPDALTERLVSCQEVAFEESIATK
jgi:Tc5 transposase DNA-binding domain